MRDVNGGGAAIVQAAQQLEHLSGRAGVEVACGFIAEQDPGFARYRPGDSGALLLAAGQFKRQPVTEVAETDRVR